MKKIAVNRSEESDCDSQRGVTFTLTKQLGKHTYIHFQT